MTYTVPEANVETLFAKLTRFSAKTVKAGNPPILFNRTGIFTDQPHPVKANVLVRMIEVEVTTEAPAYSGWRFMATLCATDEGNIVRAIPGYDVPVEYRDGAHHCDHCNTNRRRNDTYIVRHDDGRTLRVGSSCVQDFLQHSSPNSFTKAARLCLEAHALADAAKSQDWLGGHAGRNVYRVDLDTFLGFVAQEVLTTGRFVTRKQAQDQGRGSTADVAYNAMMNEGRVEVSPAAVQLATAARDFVRAAYAPTLFIESDDEEESVRAMFQMGPKGTNDSLSDFEHNLYTVSQAEAIEPRFIGIAAFIVEAYRRATTVKAVVKPSKHIGAVGERLRGVAVTCTKIVQSPADGYTHLYDKTFCIFTDNDGNVYTWSASGLLDFVVNGRYSLIGTVKKHSDFHGRPQTELSRCKLEEILVAQVA